MAGYPHEHGHLSSPAPGRDRIALECDTKTFYEGVEFCREYFRNDLLWFGFSLVNPGDTGAADPGHEGAWEVFYCVSGEGILDDGTAEYPLKAGDALVVPPPVPHWIHNRSSQPVLMVWAGGPSNPGVLKETLVAG